MATKPEKMSGLARQRQLRESKNLFSRLPAVYAASRKQGQYLLRQSAGISIVEWRTLWDLTEAGPLTIRELAKIQRTDHSLVSRALPAMRNKGLVEMHQNPEDGRETLVAITTQGIAAFDLAAPTMQSRRLELSQRFTSSELDQFVEFLDRLEDFLRSPADALIKKNEFNK